MQIFVIIYYFHYEKSHEQDLTSRQIWCSAFHPYLSQHETYNM
jgi:hypothetical protein